MSVRTRYTSRTVTTGLYDLTKSFLFYLFVIFFFFHFYLTWA